MEIVKEQVETPNRPSGIFLYHGTSSKYFNAIELGGLVPRSSTGNDNHEKQGLSSDASFVYLSDRYHFAHALSTVMLVKGDVLLVRVSLDDLDFGAFFPDEDAIFTLLSKKNHIGFANKTLVDQLKISRESIRENQKLWFEFFKMGGTVAHLGTISPDVISYSIFPRIRLLEKLYLRKDRHGKWSGIVDGANDLQLDFHRAMSDWAFGSSLTQRAFDQIKEALHGLGLPRREVVRLIDEFLQVRPAITDSSRTTIGPS